MGSEMDRWATTPCVRLFVDQMHFLEALGQHGTESSLQYGLDGLGCATRASVILDGSQKLRRATFHPWSSAGPRGIGYPLPVDSNARWEERQACVNPEVSW